MKVGESSLPFGESDFRKSLILLGESVGESGESGVAKSLISLTARARVKPHTTYRVAPSAPTPVVVAVGGR